jgi:hypothetical protein
MVYLLQPTGGICMARSHVAAGVLRHYGHDTAFPPFERRKVLFPIQSTRFSQDEGKKETSHRVSTYWLGIHREKAVVGKNPMLV